MIYSSYEFLIGLPLLITLFYALPSQNGQLVLIGVASVVFLAWTTIWNLLPVGIVIGVVFVFLRANSRFRIPGAVLGLLVAFLVIQLGYFRYRDFISQSFGIHLPFPEWLVWLIPLGISFYTFEAISAAVDLHRRRQPVTFGAWSLFIMFLPHLVAGPIIRYRTLVPQFSGRKSFRIRALGIGLHFFLIGFVKKMVADATGQVIDPVWSAPSQSSALALTLALLGFFAQLYLDFSGYTDMGRGIARALGYRLPVNFRGPAFAVTPSEFYQRWHVSLSSWIRTFVYDTLAVAVLRRFKSRKTQNYVLLIVVLFVMSLFGLWHGSAWHYVLFGLVQGAVIVAWASRNRGRPPKSLSGKVLSGILLQLTWLFSLILFRADDLEIVASYLQGFTRFHGWTPVSLVWCIAALAVTLGFQAAEYCVSSRKVSRALCFFRVNPIGISLCAAGLILALSFKINTDLHRVLSGAGGIGDAGFIYFRF